MSEKDTTKGKTKPALSGPKVIAKFVKILPSGSGVYRMLDVKGDVIYVGKARNLKKRVTAYTKTGGHTNRIAKMISLTTDMEFVTTRSETGALLLEANLIKKFMPRFNVILRDDKSFPYILVRRDHDIPQILKHRGSRSIKGEYYGPFASAGSVNRTLNVLQRAFLLRTCSDSTYESRSRPCLLYQIKRCSAPCTGEISIPEYGELVDQAVGFLKGKDLKIHEEMTERMEKASKALDFETAAIYRDRVKALSHIHLHQGINPNTVSEADVIAVYQDGGTTCVQVFFFRAGQNWGNRAYFPRHDKGIGTSEILEAFVSQFYDNKPIPKQILLSEEISQNVLIEEAFSIRSERKIEILVPQRGEKRALIDHAITNAKEALERRMAESASQRKLLEGVAELFDMDTPPSRIETYDNSHIQGTNALGGMIVAGPEGFMKNQYRKFNIKDPDVTPGDDYAMMREVLNRRFSRLLKEAGSDESDDRSANWPDLVLIDGGAGQLSVAEDVFHDLGVENVTLVSIAKGPERDAGLENSTCRAGHPS